MLDFELVATDRVRVRAVRGEIPDAVFHAMTSPGAQVQTVQSAEFPLCDYIAVARVAVAAGDSGVRLIPNSVLKTVLDREEHEAVWNELLTPKRARRTWDKNIAPSLSAKMRAEFLEHQRVGVAKAIFAKRYMIADDMGLGKTASAIACIMWLFAQPNHRKPRVLVVCPPKIRVQWSREIAKWTEGAIRAVIRTAPEDPDPLQPDAGDSGSESESEDQEEEEEAGLEAESECAVTVVGYSVASHAGCAALFAELFGDGTPAWDFVVMDETHDYLGSDVSKTSKLFVLEPGAVVARADRVLLLTGSASGPKKLYTQMMALYPLSMSVRDYEIEYCDGGYVPGTMMWNEARGVTHAAELHVWFSRRMVRRMKDVELAGQLPTQTIEVVSVRVEGALLAEYRAHERARAHAIAQAAAGSRQAQMQVKNLTNEMFKALTRAKMPMCLAWIEEHATKLWDTQKQKTAVFTHFSEARKALAVAFPRNSVVVDGKTPEKRRIAGLDALASAQNTETRMGMLSNRACGAGINLTPAVTMIVVVEQDHSEAVDAQLKDRIYRIGAVHPCRIVYLLAEGPNGERLMDTTVFEKVDTKFANTSAVVEGESRKRKVDVRSDASGLAGTAGATRRWGVKLAARPREDPLESEGFDDYLARTGITASLADAASLGLVSATAATVALAAGTAVPGSARKWYPVEFSSSCAAEAGAAGAPAAAAAPAWMDAVDVCVLTTLQEHEIDAARALLAGRERMQRVFAAGSSASALAAVFVRRK